MLLDSPYTIMTGVVYTALLVQIARGDARARRIANRHVAVLAVAGLVASVSVLREAVGPIESLGGLTLGFVLWLPLWLLGVIGAGDVKLAAAMGAWLGIDGVVTASILAAVAGGVMAVAVLIHRGAAARLAADIGHLCNAVRITGFGGAFAARPTPASHARTVMPYGVALAAGGLLTAWLPAQQLAWLAW